MMSDNYFCRSYCLTKESYPARDCRLNYNLTLWTSMYGWAMQRQHCVQPGAMSVSTNVCRKAPSARWPQWATRSASMNPGLFSVQSEKVRTGTWCFSSGPDLVVPIPRGESFLRNGRKSRSAVAGLRDSSCSRTSSVSTRWPWRSRTGVSSGKNGTRRLLQMQLAATQATVRTSCTAAPYRRARGRLTLCGGPTRLLNRRIAYLRA